jgi:hypothetical protein
MERVDMLKKIHQNIAKMQQTSVRYQNKRRKMAPQLKKKDKVYLSTKNLRYKKNDKK